MLLKNYNKVTFEVFSFSEKSRDPRVLRSVQKYHVFQRFYGNSLETVSSKIIVTQTIKSKKDFSGPKSKKAHVSSIYCIKLKKISFSFLKLIFVIPLVVSFYIMLFLSLYIYACIFIYDYLFFYLLLKKPNLHKKVVMVFYT